MFADQYSKNWNEKLENGDARVWNFRVEVISKRWLQWSEPLYSHSPPSVRIVMSCDVYDEILLTSMVLTKLRNPPSWISGVPRLVLSAHP